MTARRVLAPFAALVVFLVLPAPLPAKPAPLPKIVQPGVRSGILDETARTRAAGTLSAAGQGTLWFGGTMWAADSARWEAIPGGVWTFDSGVGSSFSPDVAGVNPFKDPSLHTLMEGWIGIDNTYGPVSFFRRLGATDFTAEGVASCVGSAAGLQGDYSLWCGVLPHEADSLCYAETYGYGNNWFVCREHAYTYDGTGTVSLGFDYRVDLEPNFDYAIVYSDTTGQDDDVEVTRYDGTVSGTAVLILTPGTDLRSSPGPYAIKFCVSSDGAYSDQDGSNPTTCGALALDEISVQGGGVNDFADFETGDGGWVLSPPLPGLGGDWSDLRDMADLPPISYPCGCSGPADSVLVFYDPTTGGHAFYQDNIAASPWIDLARAGKAGDVGKILEYQAWMDSPFKNYIFQAAAVQWSPAVCPRFGGPYTSPFTSPGFIFEYPTGCRGGNYPVQYDFSSIIDENAEQVRVAVGVYNYCQFYGNCSGLSDTTPWFDNVRFGVYGLPDAPYLSTSTVDVPQDAFPTDGTLAMTSPGRVDCNNVKGYTRPAPYSELGDTLVVDGGTGGAEVRVVFAVDPGPGIDITRFVTWRAGHRSEGSWRGLDWYSARMDTAELGGTPVTGAWMTAYHEEDPNFRGADTDRDPGDLDPLGRQSRLANDIFPDDLFTAGTRLCLYYEARYLSGTTWYTAPDTAGGNYYEMEILPSSMAADSTFNCVLYVDHFDGRGAQPFIEAALRNVLTGGSANFENVPWDRWDVRAPASDQGSFGRPLHTDYGATLTQALGYRTIVWNSGNLNGVNLVKEDAEILIPWLASGGADGHARNLYLSGDGLVESVTEEVQGEGTGPLTLLQDYCGVVYTCGTFRDADCGPGTVEDTVSCVPMDPVTGGHFVAGSDRVYQGNGCPNFRSFDVIAANPAAESGDARGNLSYHGPAKGVVDFASVSNAKLTGIPYRTVVDGGSIHVMRDAGNCAFTTAGYPDEPAVDARLAEVLGWFGATGGDACTDHSATTGIEPPVAEPPSWGLRILGANPVVRGGAARFAVSAPAGASVTVAVYDVAGRRVRVILDGRLPQPETTVSWDLADGSGRRVTGGIYFVRLLGAREVTRKLVVVP